MTTLGPFDRKDCEQANSMPSEPPVTKTVLPMDRRSKPWKLPQLRQVYIPQQSSTSASHLVCHIWWGGTFFRFQFHLQNREMCKEAFFRPVVKQASNSGLCVHSWGHFWMALAIG